MNTLSDFVYLELIQEAKALIAPEPGEKPTALEARRDKYIERRMRAIAKQLVANV